MKSLFGLLCVLIIIYGLYLIFSSSKEGPDVYEIEKDAREAFPETLADENEALSTESGEEHADSREDALPEKNETEEDKGFLSGAKNYLLSAIEDYKEILKSDEDSRGGESKESISQIARDEESREKNNVLVISIYEEILGLRDAQERGDE